MGVKYIIDGDTLTDIADAIRSKLETEDTYAPTDMAEAIESIEGSGNLQEKTVTANGIVLPDPDYDGMSKVTVSVPVANGQSF